MIQLSPMQYSIGVLIVCEIIDENNLPVDVSDATVKRIYVEKPSGKQSYWDAAFSSDGTDGLIQFTTTKESDLDEFGNYRIQAYVEDSHGKTMTSVSRFNVKKILCDHIVKVTGLTDVM